MSHHVMPHETSIVPDHEMAVWLARLTIAGIVLYLILDVIAQLLPPHYSPIHQAESDLAVGHYGYVMTINFVVRGFLSFALLFSLTHELPLPAHSRFGQIALGIWSAGAFLLALFPADVTSGHHTFHGVVHIVVAVIAFASVATAEVLISRKLSTTNWPAKTRALFTTLALWTALTLLLLALSSARPRVGGLFERLFIASALLWMLMVALQIAFGSTPAMAPTP
ncbi:MAG TPA: DUF998 domain-containing protein [Nitrolancea sp.]|jgi:hypothetical membrane protein|nr:DUF998 domain-containing protein [Nitrolancea sp.]